MDEDDDLDFDADELSPQEGRVAEAAIAVISSVVEGFKAILKVPKAAAAFSVHLPQPTLTRFSVSV